MFLSAYDLLPVFDWEIADMHQEINNSKRLQDTLFVPVVLGAFYYVSIFSIQSYMRDKKAYDLRYALALWSFGLSFFSFWGAVRTVPVVYEIFFTRGWDHMVCGDTRMEWIHLKPSGLWVYWFCLSKVPELFDTLFIVLRKKKLITLHWYHHITVLLFCWHSWASLALCGIVFAAMNLSVHTVMYFFYGLTALGYRPTKYAQAVTIGQILQMVVGTSVQVYIVYHQTYVSPKPLEASLSVTTPDYFYALEETKQTQCVVSSQNGWAGLVMYGSYLGFFVDFYLKAYVYKKKPSTKSKAQ